MIVFGNIFLLTMWLFALGFQTWRVSECLRSGRSEFWPGFPAYSRTTQPIRYWLHMTTTGAVMAFIAFVGIAIIGLWVRQAIST